MGRLFTFLLSLVLALALSFTLIQNEAVAGKKKNKSNLNAIKSLGVVNREGKANIYGSFLDPNENELYFLLPKPLLNAVRKMGLHKLKVRVTSDIDSSKTYTVPPNSLSIQNKNINKVNGKYLVVNLFNLTTPSGVTLTPNAIPSSDDYRFRFVGEDLDITTEKFTYETPILITGVVDSNNPGFVTVENNEGKQISDKVVAINLNGTFLTEVRPNKLNKENSLRKKIKSKKFELGVKSQNNEEDTEKVKTGFVHAVTDKDFYAVTVLDNDVKLNAQKVKKPLRVDEASTLVANLGKEYDELADELGNDELKELGSEEPEEEFVDFGCDIHKFADKCDLNDKEVLASIGQDFKDFVQTEDCDFPEFNLIKQIVSAAPSEVYEFIGQGYCENSLRDEDGDKPCQIYSEVLSDFKTGFISKLPCPPEFCMEFRNIKPPRCEEVTEFCEEDDFLSEHVCVQKPREDVLYCAKIGEQVEESQCLEGASNSLATWTTVTSTDGNQYCAPASIYNPSTGFVEGVAFSNSESIANACETFSCHRDCNLKFGRNFTTFEPVNFTPADGNSESSTCEPCECHFDCEVHSGNYIDCSDPNSQFFSSRCCDPRVVRPEGFDKTSNLIRPGSFRGPIPLDIRSCLCSDKNNFDEVGYVNESAKQTCSEACPEGYEKDPDRPSCLPICPRGFVRNAEGFCKKKCSIGFIEDEFGNCECPEGKVFSKVTGKCEIVNCPEHCKNIPLGRKLMEHHDLGFSGGTPTSTTFSPTGSFGTGSGFTGNLVPVECRQCVNDGNQTCGVDQYIDREGICRCNTDGSIATSLGPEGCSNQNKCGSNMFPNPNKLPGEAECICPSGLPYWDGARCIAQCPNGNPPPALTASLLPKSPIPCNSGVSQCPQSTPYRCADGTCTVTAATCPTTCPPATPYQCPDGACAISQANCSGTQTNYCPPGIVPTQANPCTCGSGAFFGSGNTCQCSSPTQTYTKEYGCSPLTICPPATPIRCADGTCAVTALSCPCPTTAPVRCSDGTCALTAANCPTQCPIGAYLDTTTNSCRCSDSTKEYVSGVCQCKAGLLPDPQHSTSSCICPTGSELNYTTNTCVTGSITITSAVLSGSDLVVTVTKSLPVSTCIYLKKEGNTTTLYSICGDGTQNIPTASLSPAVVAGDQVKFCNPSNTICSGLVTVTSQ